MELILKLENLKITIKWLSKKSGRFQNSDGFVDGSR